MLRVSVEKMGTVKPWYGTTFHRCLWQHVKGDGKSKYC